MKPYKVAVIGYGKIAQDQHLPVIANDQGFSLAAVVTRHTSAIAGVERVFRSPAELYAALPDVDAVAICTTPAERHGIARAALLAGKHVLLEKPPTATLTELDDLIALAGARHLTLFATWHSQFNAAVDETKRILAEEGVASLAITWKEDVRHWHPGQKWIWAPGGFGVFDPGINALSIAVKIMPAPLFARAAELFHPANSATPIAADLTLDAPGVAGPLTAVFDWRHTGTQTWDIDIVTETGARLALTKGGSRLAVNGATRIEEPPTEYQQIYRRFGELLRRGASDLDQQPFRLVADALLVGRRHEVEAFHD